MKFLLNKRVRAVFLKVKKHWFIQSTWGRSWAQNPKVSSSKMVRPRASGGGRWIGQGRRTRSTVCYSAPHLLHKLQKGLNLIYVDRIGIVRHRCGGGKVRPTLFFTGPYRECGWRCREWKYGVFPTTPLSIGLSPRAPYVYCYRQTNWWILVWQVQMGVWIYKWVSRWTGQR